MHFEAADKMKNFEAGIFNILDDKKKELEAQGRKIYNFSVGTPDFEPQDMSCAPSPKPACTGRITATL